VLCPLILAQARVAGKRISSGAATKPLKQELKEENRSAKAAGRTASTSVSERDHITHSTDGKQTGPSNGSTAVTNGNTSLPSKGSASSTRTDVEVSELRSEGVVTKSSDSRGSLRDDGADLLDLPKPLHPRSAHSPRQDAKSGERQQKRASPAEEPDRLHKRRKGELDTREIELDTRLGDRERIIERVPEKSYPSDFDKSGAEEIGVGRGADKHLDRTKDRNNEKIEREYRERSERIDKARADDVSSEKLRDRSMERYGRERSVDRMPERRSDRGFDGISDKARDERSKDDRVKLRSNEMTTDKSHNDDRFHSQNLPPPPPLPPHMVPQSVASSRRDEDVDRRFGTSRHAQRLSPRHEEKERRRSEENLLTLQDDPKRRREEEFRERKREERESLAMKVCEIAFCKCVYLSRLCADLLFL